MLFVQNMIKCDPLINHEINTSIFQDEDRLRMMGVDTKVGNFLLYDNNWVSFFEWMLANTTDENIYTDMELKE